MFIEQDLKLLCNIGNEPTVSAVQKNSYREMESIWNNASISIVSHTRNVKRIRLHQDKYTKLLKPYKGRIQDPLYLIELIDFQVNGKETLFDIAACNCYY